MSDQGPGQQQTPGDGLWNAPPPTSPPVAGLAPPLGPVAGQPPFMSAALPPNYPPAHPSETTDAGLLVRRMFARIVDGLCLAPLSVFLLYRYFWDDYKDYFDDVFDYSANGSLGPAPEPPVSVVSILPLSYYLLAAAASFLWMFLGYYFLGATIGKKVMSIRVVDEDGSSIAGNLVISAKRAVTEWLMMVPTIGPLVSIVNLVLVLIKGNRSVYDRIAWTRVVRK